MPNFIETARALANAFERKTRDNGESFYTLGDDRPEWMQDAMFAACDNGEILPNDWTYRFAARMADHIAESLEYESDRYRSDIIAEGADSLVPYCNTERAAWLASHVSRVAYVDEAAEEYGIAPDDGVMEMIGVGIYREIEMIGNALWDAIEAQAEDEEEE